MFQVSLLSALYVSAPPIPQQKLFNNNITTAVINLSEYLFSIPCRYPSYQVSLDLNLTEVQTSTLKRATLAALWFLAARFWKSMWKAAAVFAVIKISNRLGMIEPPNPRDYPRRDRSPAPLPPSRRSSDPQFVFPTLDPESESLLNKDLPRTSPTTEPTGLGSFVIIDPPSENDGDGFPPLSSSVLANSFVVVNPDENREAPLSRLGSSWVVMDEEDSTSSSGGSDSVSNLLGEVPEVEAGVQPQRRSSIDSDQGDLSSSWSVISNGSSAGTVLGSFVLVDDYEPK